MARQGPLDSKTIAAAREALAAADGPKAAGWLVKRFKKSLKSTGSFEVTIPAGTPEPMWFRFALSVLRQRKKNWRIERYQQASSTLFYRIHWRYWERLHGGGRLPAPMFSRKS